MAKNKMGNSNCVFNILHMLSLSLALKCISPTAIVVKIQGRKELRKIITAVFQ